MAHLPLFTCFLLCFSLSLSTNVPQCQFSLDAAKQAANSGNTFGWALYEKLIKPDQNLVFSPVSISLALALVESGASGETQNEIRSRLGANQLESNVLYGSLQHQLQIKDEEKTKLNIANGFFYSRDLTVKPEFVNKTKQCFETQVENVQFKTDSEAARRHINQWISEKTVQKIPELFKGDSINAQTVAVLANALYLKAAWEHPFRQSQNLSFYKFGRDETQTVSFMIEERRYSYAENERMQVVEIPYAGTSGLVMYIVLPKQRDGLQGVETATKDEYDALWGSFSTRKVNLKLPKFTIRSSANLKEVLQQLGINKMFSEQADLSRMSDQRLMVSSAVHEAFIKVNENGTEAAAATGFGISLMSMPRPETPVQFTADHPFAFVIKHVPTKANIFAGRVVKVDQD
jgi:serpin B